MRSFLASLRNLVLPYGRTSGRRIILDGDNGRILIYDTLDRLVGLLDSATPPGLTVGASTARQVKVIADGTTGRVAFPANSPLAQFEADALCVVFNEGLANESSSLQFRGPSEQGATDRLELLLNSQNADGSSQANLGLRVANGGGTILSADVLNGLSVLRRLAVGPPAAANSAVLVSAAAGHTGAILLTVLGGSERLRLTAEGRLTLELGISASPAFSASAPLGYTGLLAQLLYDTDSKFSVDRDGNVAADGNIVAAGRVAGANLASGTAQTPAPGGAPAQTSVAVNFAASFASTPVVVVTPNSTATNLNTTNLRWAVTGKSTTGFTINCWRDTNNPTNFEWVAYI